MYLIELEPEGQRQRQMRGESNLNETWGWKRQRWEEAELANKRSKTSLERQIKRKDSQPQSQRQKPREVQQAQEEMKDTQNAGSATQWAECLPTAQSSGFHHWRCVDSADLQFQHH